MAEAEQTLVDAPAMAEEFADRVVEEIFSDSSTEDIREGGYEEPRLSPTQEPSSGWPENTPQSIHEAAAAITDPDLKQHSDDVKDVLEPLHQQFFCVACGPEVSAQKDPHRCSTCLIVQCKTCVAKHWLEVDGVCAQFASWSMVQWARTTLQVKLQKYQYRRRRRTSHATTSRKRQLAQETRSVEGVLSAKMQR